MGSGWRAVSQFGKVAQASACKIPKSSYYLEQAEACATSKLRHRALEPPLATSRRSMLLSLALKRSAVAEYLRSKRPDAPRNLSRLV